MTVQLREPEHERMQEHFDPTDPNPKYEITRIPLVKRLFKSRVFQFAFILPNQIIFWLVIFTGLLGIAAPTRNFSTVITWYIWFFVVFLLMVGVGRAWCLMCPFGGFGEWVQRKTPWGRKTTSLTAGRRWSQALSRYGLLPSVALFVGLTWAEEFLNIAGPGDPQYTSYLVIFIISLALTFFLWTERRTFCRYLCPLTALIGSVGSTGTFTGFRTKDRNICLTCPTKDCIRGSENGYGCPWYEWPGSATSNLYCGLCTECFKNCPYDNIGLFVQPPLTSLAAPKQRRWDVAVAVVALLGLVVFQQLNALPLYTTVDNALNKAIGIGYPNPVDYIGMILGIMGVVAGCIWVVKAVFEKHPLAATSANSRWQSYARWFKPLAYGLTPLMAADFLARQLPRFWDHALRIVPAISDPFDLGWNLFGTAHSSLYNVHILSTAGVVASQLIVVAIGALGALYVTLRIVRRDMKPLASRPVLLQAASSLFIFLTASGIFTLYIAMGGAQ